MAARGLGKGLDALIPSGINEKSEKTEKQKKTEEKSGGETIVNITKVEPNREQPRKILMRMLWRSLRNQLNNLDFYSQFLFRIAKPIMRSLPVKEDGVRPKKQA